VAAGGKQQLAEQGRQLTGPEAAQEGEDGPQRWERRGDRPPCSRLEPPPESDQLAPPLPVPGRERLERRRRLVRRPREADAAAVGRRMGEHERTVAPAEPVVLETE